MYGVLGDLWTQYLSPSLLCDSTQHTLSLPPCCSGPWLGFWVPPPPAGCTPGGISISDVPGVSSWASFSSSERGRFRVHHVRRASWREGKHCLDSVPFEGKSPCKNRGAPPGGNLRAVSCARNKRGAGRRGLAISLASTSFGNLLCLSHATC